jgi:hypothetical protein
VALTKVGVGAGGTVSGGSAEPDGTMIDGGAPLGARTATLSPGRDGNADCTVATGFGVRGRQSTTDDVGVVEVAFGGAAPIPPAPAGSVAGAGAGAGVPTVQPAVTAKGSPRATTLKKMDRGESRTFQSPDGAPEKLRRTGIRPELTARGLLDQPRPRRVLSIGSHRMRPLATGREMNSGRPRALAAMLTLALGAGTVAGAGLLGSPAWAEGTLTGTYTLDSTSIWTGQRVTLTQNALEDSTPDTVAERTVDWGDGSPVETLGAEVVNATHQYPVNGSYPVKVTLTDADADAGPGTVTMTNADATVQVATAGGAVKFSVASNWTWEGGGATAKLLLSAVPATATRVWVDWGDGKTSLLARTHTSTTHYYPVGTHTAQVTLENAQGKTTGKRTGSYTVKVDRTKPSSTLKVPSKPSKASYWKTVQGTAKDGQIGMDAVGVQLWKWTKTKDYYYNFSTKKWVKYNPKKPKIPKAALSWRGVDAKGVWKVGVAGLKKGYYFEVDYVAVDRAGNDTGWKYRVQKLTS